MSWTARVLFPLLLCSFIVVVPTIWANWIEDGIPICTATGNRSAYQITFDGTDGAIVIWTDYRSDDNDIYAQRLNTSGVVTWTADGVAVCTATGSQYEPRAVSDGAGGALVTWYDSRNSFQYDIYAQRIDARGTVLWTADGVPVCTETGTQRYPRVASDGAGGAIVTWQDTRGSDTDIYAQRVDASGAVLWTADGVALCEATKWQTDPQVVSDGMGGAIVAWDDARGDNDHVFAQRVDAAGRVQWTADGVLLCAAAEHQLGPRIVSDGAGGAIVAWEDLRGSDRDVYAQRIDASGTVQWTAYGMPVCKANGNQRSPEMISNEAGGAIVAWEDYRGTDLDVYAQRINNAGTVQWTPDGLPLCVATGDQAMPEITTDGARGAIFTWDEVLTDSGDVYCQRVDASGVVRWTPNGVPICKAVLDEFKPLIASDGAGGAFVAWSDSRNSGRDIYAQWIDSQGRVGYLPPVINSVRDVPGDQGGWVRLTISRPTWDHESWYTYPVSLYNVWQRVDDPVLLATIDEGAGAGRTSGGMSESSPGRSPDPATVSGWPLVERNDRRFVRSREFLQAGEFPSGTWELLGSFAACQKDEYIFRTSTLADSTESGIPYSFYMVSVHTTTPSVWYTSGPASGYSVDNLPPEVPDGLAAEQSSVPEGLSIAWNANVENDLSHYALYRGSSEDFLPVPGNRIATPTHPEYFDDEWRWDTGYYYKVSALDTHGNESPFALLALDDIVGGDHSIPKVNFIAQNSPNPFNPITTIAFGIREPGRVSLTIFDVTGRHVRTLSNEHRKAGTYVETWDGTNSSGSRVASGVYFYTVTAKGFVATKKMVLVE